MGTAPLLVEAGAVRPLNDKGALAEPCEPLFVAHLHAPCRHIILSAEACIGRQKVHDGKYSVGSHFSKTARRQLYHGTKENSIRSKSPYLICAFAKAAFCLLRSWRVLTAHHCPVSTSCLHSDIFIALFCSYSPKDIPPATCSSSRRRVPAVSGRRLSPGTWPVIGAGWRRHAPARDYG